jgi:hypothetical protein
MDRMGNKNRKTENKNRKIIPRKGHFNNYKGI